MADIQIEDFKAGLDLRRLQFMTQAGSLLTARNVHINRGGEIEKRKAFVVKDTLPPNTFGLLGAQGTLYVFGSVAAPTMPSGYTYQRCQAPDGTAMTGVVRARLYGGKPYVLATFASGRSYHFYDGAVVTDWYGGIAASWMTNNSGLATHIASLINGVNGYTATALGSVVTVTGPLGVAFTTTIAATNGGSIDDQTITVATTQFSVPIRAETPAQGSFRITNGSSNPGVSNIGVINIQFNGNVYDALGGVKIDWSGSNEATAQAVADRINLVAATPEYTAAAVGDMVQIFGGPGLGSTGNGVLKPFAASSVVICTGWFEVVAGTNSAGVNKITSYQPNGRTVRTMNVDWVTDNATTAENFAAAVRALAGPETAVAIGARVYIGDTNGGHDNLPGTISVICGGNVRIVTSDDSVQAASKTYVWDTTVQDLAGGVSAYAGVSQISTLTIGGSFDPGDGFTITINDAENGDYIFGVGAVTGEDAVDVLALDTKMYAAFGSVAGFSGVNTPTQWNNGVGNGFITFANVSGEMLQLKALAEYEKGLAAIARSTTAIWNIDPDPALNSRRQILKNIGTIATRSVQSYGGRDTYMLHDSGFRSIRPHMNTEIPTTFDVGTYIDDYVVAQIKANETAAAAAHSIIEPESNRYWCYLNGRIFVLTQFERERILGWSIYDDIPAFSEFEISGRSVYARAGDTIYIYGGTNGTTYDTCEAEVELPYLHARRYAAWKRWTAINFAVDGLWQVYMNTDPANPSREELIANFDGVTYGFEDSQFDAESAAVKLRFKSTAAERALISAVSISYDER